MQPVRPTTTPDSIHCTARVHCRACRTDAAWRQSVGLPETCPEGFTAARLPTPQRPRDHRQRPPPFDKLRTSRTARLAAIAPLRQICHNCPQVEAAPPCPERWARIPICHALDRHAAILAAGERPACPEARF